MCTTLAFECPPPSGWQYSLRKFNQKFTLRQTRPRLCYYPGGGTDQERGYGDVRPWRPPFHASPAARKGPISSKRISSQDHLLRKFGNFSLNSLNFYPNFSSQTPKFGNFQLTSPPFSEANVSSQAPHFGNPGRTPLPEKKLSAPRGYYTQCIVSV